MKDKYLLVSVAGVPNILSDFIPDIGLASLAASLIENGNQVKILDLNTPSLLSEIFSPEIRGPLDNFSRKVFLEGKKPNFKDILVLKAVNRKLEKSKQQYCEKLKAFLAGFVEKEEIGCVGFKLWAGEGFSWSLEAGRHLKKRFPDLKIIGGGPQVDIFGREIYKVGGFFDALCYCEGEKTISLFADFVKGKEKLADIPNIIFLREGEIIQNPKSHIEDIDSLPLPVYDPDVYLNIDQQLKVLVLEESRGCPNACHFCIHPVKSGKRRTKSVSKIVNEIKEYKKRYGIKFFKYAGSSTPGTLMEAVAEKIIQEGVDVKYTGFGHVNDFNVDFNLLKRSGCESIFFGVETVNTEILKKGTNKDILKDDMERVLTECREAGIFTVASLIYPAPFETADTRRETLEFMDKVMPDSVLVQFPGIYPGTMWFKFPERFNFQLEIDKDEYPFRVMTYQIKNLFPPRYWDPLPYRVNGLPFRRVALETEKFQKDLQAAGLETSVSDEAYILYTLSGYKSLKEFLSYNRYFFYSGNREKLCAELEHMNKNAGSYEG